MDSAYPFLFSERVHVKTIPIFLRCLIELIGGAIQPGIFLGLKLLIEFLKSVYRIFRLLKCPFIKKKDFIYF